jgi:RTA1 like protein
MLVGICLQLIGLTAYSALAIEFGARYYYDRPMPRHESEMLRGSHKFTKSMSRLVQVMLFATIVLFIRYVNDTVLAELLLSICLAERSTE